jgi:hypothetical protein
MVGKQLGVLRQADLFEPIRDVHAALQTGAGLAEPWMMLLTEFLRNIVTAGQMLD